MITAAHCVYERNKENILILTSILADNYATKKERKRFGQTTHHVDKIRLHEDFVKGQERAFTKFTKFDIGLLRVKEPFTGAVNFARLPPLHLNVEGKNAYNGPSIIYISI